MKVTDVSIRVTLMTEADTCGGCNLLSVNLDESCWIGGTKHLHHCYVPREARSPSFEIMILATSIPFNYQKGAKLGSWALHVFAVLSCECGAVHACCLEVQEHENGGSTIGGGRDWEYRSQLTASSSCPWGGMTLHLVHVWARGHCKMILSSALYGLCACQQSSHTKWSASSVIWGCIAVHMGYWAGWRDSLLTRRTFISFYIANIFLWKAVWICCIYCLCHLQYIKRNYSSQTP